MRVKLICCNEVRKRCIEGKGGGNEEGEECCIASFQQSERCAKVIS